jgi:hypothetical protein
MLMGTISHVKFWEYAYSNFLDNRNRSALAEYIVAEALDVNDAPLSTWEPYDIKTKCGIKVEVKASGYIQAWRQNKPSTPTFDIAKKFGFHIESNLHEKVKDRQADVYVFCLHKEKNHENVNPLLTNQWTFYVVETNLINKKLGDQKSVRISTIENILGVKQIAYSDLRDAIMNSFKKTDRCPI